MVLLEVKPNKSCFKLWWDILVSGSGSVYMQQERQIDNDQWHFIMMNLAEKCSTSEMHYKCNLFYVTASICYANKYEIIMATLISISLFCSLHIDTINCITDCHDLAYTLTL